MKISAPIVTLIAGGALAGGLLVANGLTAGGTTRDAGVDVAGSAAVADDAAAENADQADDADDADQPEGNGAGAGEDGANEDKGAEAAVAGADAGAEQELRQTYAGRVQGGGPLLAISVRDDVAIAYLCDGKLEAWLEGKVENGRLSLTGTDARLTGTVNEDRARGSVTVGQRTWQFTAKTVKPPGGLWKATAEVRGARVRAGWVVLEDGSQVGLFTRDEVDGTTAPRLDAATGTATIDGEPIPVRVTDAETGAGF